VRPADEVDVVFLAEALHDFLTEGEGDSAVVLTPTLHVLVGVGPEEVAQEPRVWHVRRPHDALDLFQRVQFGRESPVHADDLLVDQRGDGQAVEAVCERLPNANVVPAFALVVEPVDTVDRGALVVASQQEEVLWVLYLVCEQQTHRLQRLLPTVHVVAQEQVVRVWGEPAVFEQSQQIEELAMHVA